VKLADLPVSRSHFSGKRRRAPVSDETRARLSAATKRAWADPDYRERMTAQNRTTVADPAVRARISASAKSAAGPAEKARRSERAKRLWEARPDIQAKFRRNQMPGKKLAAETRERIGEAARRKWKDRDYRARVVEAEREALARPEERERRSRKARAFWARVRAAMGAQES